MTEFSEVVIVDAQGIEVVPERRLNVLASNREMLLTARTHIRTAVRTVTVEVDDADQITSIRFTISRK